jgi:hypothetical protein
MSARQMPLIVVTSCHAILSLLVLAYLVLGALANVTQ